MIRSDYALSPAQRTDAREALALLEGSGITLAEAARRALMGRRAAARITCSAAATTFLGELLKRNPRPGTYDWYEQRITYWLKGFGARLMDEVSRDELIKWFGALPGSEKGRRPYAKAVRALWRWALAHDPQYVAADVTVGLVPRQPLSDSSIRFLSVEECSAILNGAGPYRNAIALGLFAGVRPEEIAGKGKPWMLWQHVHVDERIVRVPAEISKTRKPRPIEGLPDALWAWLSPKKANEAISPGRARQIADRAKVLAGYGPGSRKGRWPADIIRHTFATYAVALLGEGAKVSTWLGHEGDSSMLHRHYRGATSKVQAEAFFGLRPA